TTHCTCCLQRPLRSGFRQQVSLVVRRNVDLGRTTMEGGGRAHLRLTTTRGTDTVLDEATMQGFQTSVRGPLLRLGDEGYDEARTIWNAMIGKRPALIVRCAGVADGFQAVLFPRPHPLLWPR